MNYNDETEEHKIKPHQLRNLRAHECVLVHCERGFRRMALPPLESDGTVARCLTGKIELFGGSPDNRAFAE
jgi:hypothetical protein